MKRVRRIPGFMTHLLSRYIPALLVAAALILLFFYVNRSTEVPPM